MVSVRAVAAGVLVFPVVVVWAALAGPFVLLFVGVVPGVVASALAPPGGRSGLVHGLVVGGLCTVLCWVVLLGWLTLSPPARVAPGFGISVFLLAALGLLAGVESVVGGLFVGLARR